MMVPAGVVDPTLEALVPLLQATMSLSTAVIPTITTISGAPPS